MTIGITFCYSEDIKELRNKRNKKEQDVQDGIIICFVNQEW